MHSASEVAHYRGGTASLLAESVEAAGKVERWLDSGPDGGEVGSLVQAWLSETEEELSSAMAIPDDDPARLYRIISVLLLRKTQMHGRAVLRANEANNVHSLAVQMRPALECAGQVVRIFHHLIIAPDLLMEPKRAIEIVGSYINADYYRMVIRITKGSVGHEELLQRISEAEAEAAEAEGFPKPERRSGKSLKQKDKVTMLPGGPGWYDHLSEYFCHGEANWQGPSWVGGVTSMDATHELTCASMMGYLAEQVSAMSSYASLCPVAGKADFDRAMAAQAQRRQVREASAALWKATGLVAEGNEAGEG